MIIIESALLIIGSYLLGSVPLAFLIAKWEKGIDLRKYGSGNVGMSNLWKQTSGWLAIPFIVFDLSKGAAMAWIAQLLGLNIAIQVIVGLAAVLGHNWPVFLHFNGGRGILTTLGVSLLLPAINGLIPWGGIVALFITAIGAFVFRNAPGGVAIAALSLPLISWAIGEPMPLTLGFLVILLILIFRRLTAPLTSLSASVSRKRLLINRFLLDRDINSREEWLNRAPLKTSSDEQR